MFGSSRREVIFIGAAALGLQMFEQISFDSMTWNTLVFDKRPKYFDPDTLKGHRIKNEEIIDILTPTRVMTKTQLFPFDLINRKRLLMLHNALAISKYTEDMAKIVAEQIPDEIKILVNHLVIKIETSKNKVCKAVIKNNEQRKDKARGQCVPKDQE